MKKTAAKAFCILLCLALLGGCVPAGLWKYPRPAVPEAAKGEAELLTVVLPQDADQTLQDAMELLTAKAKDVSQGALILNVVFQEDTLALYKDGDADAVLLSDTMAAQLAPELSCTQLPFLYPSREALLTALGDTDGPVRDGALGRSLEGEVLAVYYGGTVGLASRSNLYLDDVGLEGIGVLGVLEGMPGAEMFTRLGARELDQSPALDQVKRFDAKELRAMEVPMGSQFLPSDIKYFYSTGHRVRTFWLLLRDGAELSSGGREHLRQAVSYTIRSQNQARVSQEEVWLAGLMETGIEVREQNPKAVFTAAQKYAKSAYQEELGIPQKLWGKLLPAMQD